MSVGVGSFREMLLPHFSKHSTHSHVAVLRSRHEKSYDQILSMHKHARMHARIRFLSFSLSPPSLRARVHARMKQIYYYTDVIYFILDSELNEKFIDHIEYRIFFMQVNQ